jgi:hypothetical protein
MNGSELSALVRSIVRRMTLCEIDTATASFLSAADRELPNACLTKSTHWRCDSFDSRQGGSGTARYRGAARTAAFFGIACCASSLAASAYRLPSLSPAPHGRRHLRQEPDAGVRSSGSVEGVVSIMIPTPTHLHVQRGRVEIDGFRDLFSAGASQRPVAATVSWWLPGHAGALPAS